MNICIYGAASDNIDRIYIEKTEEMGKKMAKRGHTLVFGGGKTGLMGACARGMSEENGNIIGVAPKYFDEPGVLFENCTELIYTKNISERKDIFDKMSDAFIMVPGGIGTYDEFFATLVKSQLGENVKPIGVYNVNNYYDILKELLEKMIKDGFLAEKCRKLYFISDDIDKIMDYIEKA